MPTADDKIDAFLAAEALRKRRAGVALSRQEAAALRRVERATEEAKRWQFYATVPSKHLKAMVGRQANQLQNLQRDFGIPIAGRTVDIGPVLKALVDLLLDNSRRLRETVCDDPLLEGAAQTLKDEYVRQQIMEKKEVAIIRREERRRIQRRTIDVDQLRTFFAEAVPLLHDAAEGMKRDGQTEAHERLNQTLDVLQLLIDRMFDGNNDAP